MKTYVIAENGDALRRALTEKYSMTWEEFQISHKDLLDVWASKNHPVAFEELHLWERMDHRAISFDTALAYLRSLSGDVYVMSEDTRFPDCAGIIIDGVERKGEVARVNAQALADRIEFEWYEDYRLLLRDMYLATTILPADLYVFDETMEHLLVFTHETDYWELEDEDPMRCAASRLCLMAGFELPEQTGYEQIRALLESEAELKMEISYSCTMLFRQFIITKQAGAEGAAPRYAFDFDANTIYATWEAAEDAKVFNGLSLKEISEQNGVRFDLLKINRKDHTS